MKAVYKTGPCIFSFKCHPRRAQVVVTTQPRTQGTFENESTLVDRGHVVSGNKINHFQGGNIIY